MKITKYPQSCFLLEKDGRRILIDFGDVAMPKYPLAHFGSIEAVLYTHKHPDHCDVEGAGEIAVRGIPMFGNASVVETIGKDRVTEVRHGESFTIAGFKIEPFDLPHFRAIDGSEGPSNTGYIIDSHFFHPGDGIHAEGLRIAHLAAPIIGSDISFRDVFTFAEMLGAEKLIPMHYDVYGADPKYYQKRHVKANGRAEVIVLKDEESIEL